MRTLVVLAGGKSSRMGEDKRLLSLGGRSLVHWVISTLSPIVDEIILSISSTDDLWFEGQVDAGVRVVRDEHPDIGPIGGLYASFLKARGDYVATAPCDSPFVSVILYDGLFRIANGTDGAVPFIDGEFEPLHAIYKRDRMLLAMKAALDEGKKKPIEAYPFLDIVKVDAETVRGLDPTMDSFFNINTHEDLERAKRRALERDGWNGNGPEAPRN